MMRRATEADWQEVRALRLRALADTPQAFGRSVDEERAYPDDVWRERLARPDSATFIEENEGRLSAMATVIVRHDRTAEVFGMFVDPSLRRRGTGRALLAMAEAWAVGNGACSFALEVNEKLEPAVTLYGRSGLLAVRVTPRVPQRWGHRNRDDEACTTLRAASVTARSLPNAY